ncbi:predicted protein [Rickettsia japonica]|uniref:Uncharacterized protein n=2 Tax=Rickettsia japonica TaxID=35790 RepID=G4KNL0_RICJY|nr:hypothetical protein RJP_0665 [Rickettsia japonica YH]BAW83072.1 predicted protein [Rickettsia japonica]
MTESLEPFNDCNPIFIDEIICATLLPTIAADIPATFTILFIPFVITDAINNDLVPLLILSCVCCCSLCIINHLYFLLFLEKLYAPSYAFV